MVYSQPVLCGTTLLFEGVSTSRDMFFHIYPFSQTVAASSYARPVHVNQHVLIKLVLLYLPTGFHDVQRSMRERCVQMFLLDMHYWHMIFDFIVVTGPISTTFRCPFSILVLSPFKSYLYSKLIFYESQQLCNSFSIPFTVFFGRISLFCKTLFYMSCLFVIDNRLMSRFLQ